MPDFNQYAANTPFIRPEMPQTGLSLIVSPSYNYEDKMPPITQNYQDDNSKQALNKTLLGQGAADRQKLLGYTPMAPGAGTSYNVAKRYDDSSNLFLPGRDNEDLYAKNQGFWNSVGSGLGRLTLTAGTKLGSGMGYLAGLVGVDNNSQTYGDSGFNAWIAGAGDNGLVQVMDGWEDKIKNDMLPIYQEAKDKNKGFFARAATDLNFWTEDVSDGGAFLASAFVPGMAVSKLGIGARAIRGLAALKNLSYATEAGALATEGLSGTSEALSLSAQAAAQSSNELQYVPKVISWIDNAKLARSINVGTTSVVNTASESMFEANDLKNTLIGELSNKKDASGNNVYTPEQVRILAAKAAKDSYVMNLAALSISNLWEANLFFKKLPIKGTQFAGKIKTSGLLSSAELAQRTFGTRAFETVKTIGEGVAAEGFWEENIQLAIQRLNSKPENFDLNFGDKMGKLAQQYVTQTKDAISGEDTEAAMNIGLGGLIGGIANVGFTAVNGSEQSRLKKGVEALNNQVSAFKTLGNIYQQNTDGSIKFENDKPVIDDNKIKSYAASLNKILNMQEVASNLKEKGADHLAKIYQDEVFARFAKAHFDAGLGDVLHQKLNDIQNISGEDLAMLGFDPSSNNATSADQIESYKQKAVDLENLYNNINQNFLVKGNRKKDAAKQFAIADKLYYLSARNQSLSQTGSMARDKYENIKNDLNSYNESFNRASDEAVEGYNKIWEQVQSADKNAMDLVNSDYSFFMGDMISSANDEVIARQKQLNEYVKNNEGTLSKLKKDSRGRYLYEVNDKNYLPSAYEMRRLDVVQAETELAKNATLNVFARMSDPLYGEKYYDNVYSKSMETEAIENKAYDTDTQNEDEIAAANNEIANQLPPNDKSGFDALDQEQAYQVWSNTRDNSPEDKALFKQALDFEINRLKGVDRNLITDEVLDEAIQNSKALRSFGDPKLVRKAMKEELGIQDRDFGEIVDDLETLRQERDALQNRDDLSMEEENKLKDLEDQIDYVENQSNELVAIQANETIVENSNNIKPEDKSKVKDILDTIVKNKKRIVKEDDYYTIDGERYEKVTTLIGDVIPNDVRPKVQNAINAGYTIDEIVKSFFDGTINDDFRANMQPKISTEAFDSVINQLTKIQNQLRAKGIEVVASNVPVFDKENKIAGEIDLIGIDKNGNFKIYEIEARKASTYGMIERQYGRGIKIMEISKKRASAYRNLFANQYGSVPNEIAVQFPFQVSYDKENSSGFITKAKLRDAVRLPYVNTVGIALDTFMPVRSGSNFNNIDLFRTFADTFLPASMRDKMKFLLRNVSLKELKAGLTLKLRNAEEKFQERYDQQQSILNNESPSEYIPTRYKGFTNLFALVGNQEFSLDYNGTTVGFLSPAPALAYKDTSGVFHVLDHNTDLQTYMDITGNVASTFPEFKRISRSYNDAYSKLKDRLAATENKEVSLTNDELKDLFQVNVSYGELDLIPKGQPRPSLHELIYNGIKVGNKQVVTVVNVDANGNPQIMMEKGRRTKNTIITYQKADQWAVDNMEAINKAIQDKDGIRVTDNAAIIELPNGEYKVIALRLKAGTTLNPSNQFIENLGDKFTTATTKDVFKNEGLTVTPNYQAETFNIQLNPDLISNEVYEAEDVREVEQFGVAPEQFDVADKTETVNNFINSISEEQLNQLKDISLGSVEEILDGYQNSNWSSLDDFLNNLKNCKL